MASTIVAEKSVLAVLINFPSKVKSILDFLTPDHFSNPKNRTIFEVAKIMDSKELLIDLSSITAFLEKNGLLTNELDARYVNDLASNAVYESNLDSYLDILKESYLKNQFNIRFKALLESKDFNLADSNELLDKSFEIVRELERLSHKSGFVSVESIAESIKSKMFNAQAGNVSKGVTSGYFTLDKKTGGFQKGELTILAARTGVGKSAMAVNMAINAAKHGARVIFFSVEMDKEQLGTRFISNLSQISMTSLKEGWTTGLAENTRRFAKAQEILKSMSIKLDDSNASKISDIRIKSRSESESEDGVDLIIVDYLQLIDSSNLSKGASRQEQVSSVSRGLKQLARELNVPVLALAQLSRSAAQRSSMGMKSSPKVRKEVEPTLVDLRESGAIEQDADVVLFVIQEYMDNGDEYPNTDSRLKLKIAKNRQGESGVEIKLVFNKTISKIEEISSN